MRRITVSVYSLLLLFPIQCKAVFQDALFALSSFSSARVSAKFMVALLAVLAPICLVLTQSGLYASGNTIVVDTLDDPGTSTECSLRAAINNANAEASDSNSTCAAGTGNDTITFNLSGTITLSSTLPTIANSLTIDGTGQTIIVDGANLYGVLALNSVAALTLNDLAIAHGNNSSSSGGAISAGSGTLTVTDSTFSANEAASGGAIASSGGSLAVTSSTFSGNTASTCGAISNNQGTISNSTFSDNTATNGSGGAICNNGYLGVSNSTFSDNQAANGGAIFNASGMGVTNSTFNGNQAPNGSAIFNASGLNITNSTFSSNMGVNGAIFNASGMSVNDSTFSGNQGGAIFSEGGANLEGTILANNTPDNCGGGAGAVTDVGYNISDDHSCGFAGTGENGATLGDGVNPLLSVAGLQNNGGPTQTIALQSSSPAIDAIPNARCPATDQRGLARPDTEDGPLGACDIGAYEYYAPLITVNTLSDSSTSGDGYCSIREAINNADSPGVDTTAGDCATGTGADGITFSVSGTITLASTLPTISNKLTIDGSANPIVLDGANSYRILTVPSGAMLNLNALSIAHGNTFNNQGLGGGAGGGVFSEGMLNISNCAFFSNNALLSDGGAVENFGGRTTVTNSSFSNNSAELGAAISNQSPRGLIVSNTTFLSNASQGQGGGGIFNGGVMTLTNSTFFGNSSVDGNGGGGVLNGGLNSSASVTNSTFVANSTDSLGGGIANFGGTLTTTNATFSGNSAASDGGGVYNDSGVLTVVNSILSSSSGGNCSSLVSDGGYNISDDTSCGFSGTGANGDTIGDGVIDSNIGLDPAGLINNGGPTKTIKLVSGSYAVDGVPLAHQCPPTDERGGPRPEPGDDSGACDIGAFESGDMLPTPTPIASATATSTATSAATLTVTPTATATDTVTETATATPTATVTATPTATPTTSMSVTVSLAFGNVAVGETVTKTITVTNTGKINPLVISAATPSDAEFALSGTGTCGPVPITVAPKANCTLGVSFTPSALGPHGASLAIFDDAATSPQHVTLSGTGVVDFTTSKSSVVFGNVKFGAKGTASFSVTNHQAQTVSLSESFSGSNMADFSVTGGTCTATLAPKAACSIILTFKPGALGTESAMLSVSDSPDQLSPYTVSLTTGPTIPATVFPTSLAFGTLTVRVPTKTKTVTVTNLSGFSLPLSENISGTNADDFAVMGGTCTAILSPNSSCTIAVTFTPTVGPTPESASMAVTIGSDPTSPYNISLTGTGP